MSSLHHTDGSRGFSIRRTQKAGREEPVSTSMRKKGWELPSLDLLIGLAGVLLAALILALFPWLGIATGVLFGFRQVFHKLFAR